MTHLVRDWMSSPVVVIDADSSLSYALTLMRRRNIHSLVVYLGDEKNGYGILTTTDVRDKIVAAGRKPAEVTVQQVMSYPVHTIAESATLTECSQRMQAEGIHHMPVVDANNQLTGIISVTDLFVAAEETGWEDEYHLLEPDPA